MAAAITVSAAEQTGPGFAPRVKAPAAPPPQPPPTPPAKKSILEGVTVSPVGAYKSVDFVSGASEWGAGIDVGLPVNAFVSIHVRNLAFEGPGQSKRWHKDKDNNGWQTVGQKPWGGSVIDETALYGKADFASFQKDKLKLYGIGGTTHYWETEEWGFGVGLGLEYRFNEYFSAGASEEVWARTKSEKQWLTTFAVTYKFGK